MTEQFIVIITGMHRSGTSLVSSVLQKAGVHIGDRLLGPDRGNLRGHFEDIDFYQFHDKILRRFGQTLLVQSKDDLGPLTPAEIETAQALIQQRNNQLLWGWKDPRTALFLDFWHSLLPQARYIFVYRHPIEVVLSLFRRGSDLEALTNPLASLHAWQVYNRSILDFYQKHADLCLLSHISTITANTTAFIDGIVQKLGVPLQGVEIGELYQEAELKQVSFFPEVTDIIQSIIPQTETMFRELEQLADLPSYPEQPTTSQHNFQAVQKKIAELKERSNTPEAQSAQLFTSLLALLDPQAVVSGKESLDHYRLVHIKNLETQAQNLEIRTRNLETQMHHLRQQIVSKDAHIQTLNTRLANLETFLANQTVQKQNLERKIELIEQTKIWRLTQRWYTFKKTLGQRFDRPVIFDQKSLPPVSGLSKPITVYSKNVQNQNQTSLPKVLFISHDGFRAGAPIVLLHFLKWFKACSNIPFEILLKNDGELRSEFEAIGPVRLWNVDSQKQLQQANIGLIYSNTITNGEILAALSTLNCPVICHVHELEYWINHRVGPENLNRVKKYTDHYIAVSQAVKQNLVENLHIPDTKIEIIYEFIPTEHYSSVDPSLVQYLRSDLKIPPEAWVVGASGTIDWRKGPDLFIQLAQAVLKGNLVKPVHFIWVGGQRTGAEFHTLWHDIKHANLEAQVHFVGTHPNPLNYFRLFDVFALTSREDPFPLVNLELAALGKPIVCFDGSGGAKEFVEDDCGFVVPYLDVETMAQKVIDLLNFPELRQQFGRQAAQKARKRHDITIAAPNLLKIIELFLLRT